MLKKILLSCFAIFALTLFLSSNSYAVSDVSYTTTYSGSNFPSIGNFCNNDDSNLPNCSDYNYLIIESSTTTITNLFSAVGQSISTPMAHTTFSIIEIPSAWTRIGFFGISISNKDLSDYIKFTLSESYQSGIVPEGSLSITSNGTYDVSNYASATVNVDSDLPPYSELVVDSFWQYHTAFGGAVVAIIAIFLVYRVIRGRLR